MCAGTVEFKHRVWTGSALRPIGVQVISLKCRWKRTYWGTQKLHHAMTQRAVHSLRQRWVGSGMASMSTMEEQTMESTRERWPMVWSQEHHHLTEVVQGPSAPTPSHTSLPQVDLHRNITNHYKWFLDCQSSKHQDSTSPYDPRNTHPKLWPICHESCHVMRNEVILCWSPSL